MLEVNQVHMGNCLDLMPLIADASVDMILCDLPYGITACDWDIPIDLDALWIQYKRIVKPNAAIVLTGSQPFTSKLVMSNLKWFKYEWIWGKNISTGFLDANKRPLKKHESILVFSKTQTIYHPQKRKGLKHKRGSLIHRGSDSYGKFNPMEYESDYYLPECIIFFKVASERCITALL